MDGPRDPLTHLYDRQLLDKIGKEEVARAHRYNENLTLAIGDVNNFKEINDNYSHYKGDEVLKAIAQTLKERLRDSDRVFRFGGDELLIIFPNTSYEEVKKTLGRIDRKIKKIGGEKLIGRVSLGWGITSLKIEDDWYSFFRRADDLLLKQKAERGLDN